MEKSIKLDTDIVIRRKLINGKWVITIAETDKHWWLKTKKMINDIIN